MHRDDAVIRFAGGAAVLAFDSHGLLSLFGVGGLADDGDGVLIEMITPDDVAVLAGHAVLVPRILGEKVLQRPGRNARLVSDVLDILARERPDLASTKELQCLRDLERS